MSFKPSYLLAFLTLIVSACSIQYEDGAFEPAVQQQTQLKNQYGIWTQQSCHLNATRADINLSITDLYKEDKARVLLTSNVALAEDPKISVLGLADYEFNLIGHNNAYVFEIPTSNLEQARMHLNKLFVQVVYRTAEADYYRKAYFSMQELPKAMLAIKQSCI